MSDEDNITSMRPKKAPDANQRDGKPGWTQIEDALEDALADIRAGRVKPDAVVIMMRSTEKFQDAAKQNYIKTSYPHWVMGVNELELLGWLDHEKYWWNTKLLGG